MLCGSGYLVALAIFSQGCHFLFLRFVEMPHTAKVYGENRREDGTFWASVKRVADAKERADLLNRAKHTLRESLTSLPLPFDLGPKDTQEPAAETARIYEDLERVQSRLKTRGSVDAEDAGVQADISDILRRVGLLGSKLDSPQAPAKTRPAAARRRNRAET